MFYGKVKEQMTMNHAIHTRLSHAEIADLMIAMRLNLKLIVRGPKGTGKSSIKRLLMEKLGTDEYHHVRFDCAGQTVGDTALPWADWDSGTTKFLPTELFGFHTGKKLVICFDELPKAPLFVQRALTPMFEETDPSFANYAIPEGSILWATGNEDGENLGDDLPAHLEDRLCSVHLRQPNVREFQLYGYRSGMADPVLAFVEQFPEVLSSFTDPDFDRDNPYVFNPYKGNSGKYATLRGLEKCSHLIKQRHASGMTANAFTAALIGHVGETTARAMEAFIAYEDQFPPFEDIINNPDKAMLPESTGARLVLCFKLLRNLRPDTLDPIIEYACRFSTDTTALFFTSMANNPDITAMMARKGGNKTYSRWLMEHQALFG